MDKHTGKGDGNENGDCNDDDLLKGSDDAVNVVKSPKHTSNIQLVLPYKTYYIFISTMVSFIGVVVTVLMLVVISNDDQKNVFQLATDISRILNQLEILSKKINSDSSTTDGTQACKNINTSYLYYALLEENRRLKDDLQKTKPKQDSISCADTTNKPNQQKERRKEQLKVSCNSVSSANSNYGWIVANRSLSFGSSDHFNIIIQFTLSYPEISDNGKILFEFGLTTLADYLKFSYPVIIVRGQRCEKEPGMCLYVIDDASTKLEGHVFGQMSEYIQGQLTLELHKSYFVLMSNQKNIFISNTLKLSSKVELWPVFGFYNTHLINISQTIFSENKISFNRTTVDPHLFVSEDNNTISNCKLQSKAQSLSGWSVSIKFTETVFFFASTIFTYLLMIDDKSRDRFVQILNAVAVSISLLLCLPLSLYYLYMHWSLHLISVVSTFFGKLFYEVNYGTSKYDTLEYVLFTFLYSTYIVVFLKKSDIHFI